MRALFLCIMGVSYGALSAAGVFTVLVAVGLVPRFAGRTHTAGHVLLYENMVVLGTVLGCIVSLFPEWFEAVDLSKNWGTALQIRYGLFAGIFVGCLAMAIAEMLDSIPIFSRRIGFRHGLGLSVLAMAAGKLAGALFYFMSGLRYTGK